LPDLKTAIPLQSVPRQEKAAAFRTKRSRGERCLAYRDRLPKLHPAARQQEAQLPKKLLEAEGLDGYRSGLFHYDDRLETEMFRGSALAEKAIFVLPLLIAADPAFAYIDPGTGAAVTTAILGFFASIAYTFRKYMYRVKDLFAGKSRATKAKGEGGPVDR
jgi:hypothetical protein